jgi:adenylate kinase family enzyme
MINFPHLVWLMGCTGAGKTTFMDSIEHEQEIGKVRVGKMMQIKHPDPSYFKGQAAPAHTQQEAWEMCVNEIERQQDKKIIVIDGQPRSLMQVFQWHSTFYNFRNSFILLDANPEIRLERIKNKYKDRAGDLDLRTQRITNDMISYYEVLVGLYHMNVKVNIFNTNAEEFKLEDMFTLLSGHSND